MTSTNNFCYWSQNPTGHEKTHWSYNTQDPIFLALLLWTFVVYLQFALINKINISEEVEELHFSIIFQTKLVPVIYSQIFLVTDPKIK